MKKSVLIVLALLLAGTAWPQRSFYLSLGVGAGLGTASTYDFYQDNLKVYPVALGKGLNVVLRPGIFVNKFLAVELGIAYRYGFATKIEPTFDYYPEKATSMTQILKFSGNMFQLIPALVISPDLGSGKVFPYIRLGVIVGVMPSTICKIDETVTLLGGTTRTQATMKYYGGVAIGGSAAIGCDFNLGEHFALFAEIYYDALSYAPTKGKFTKFEENDVDKLPEMNVDEKEVKFVKDLTDYEPSDDQPSQLLKNSYPFNALGLTIGFKYKLK